MHDWGNEKGVSEKKRSGKQQSIAIKQSREEHKRKEKISRINMAEEVLVNRPGKKKKTTYSRAFRVNSDQTEEARVVPKHENTNHTFKYYLFCVLLR